MVEKFAKEELFTNSKVNDLARHYDSRILTASNGPAMASKPFLLPSYRSACSAILAINTLYSLSAIFLS